MVFLGLLALWFAGTLPPPTWSHDVAPLIYRHCTTCHHPGAVAPFSLLSYEDAARRAKLIATVTRKRFMPPWLPSEPHFQNERRLTAGELGTLARWVAAGAPRGNPEEAPAAPHYSSGWRLGKPDLEAEMRTTFHVPAEGPDVYQCFVIPSPEHTKHWVHALDMQPGNAAAVHHALLFQDITGTARRRDTGSGYPCFGTPGFLPARGLGGWTPGSEPMRTPEGSAILLEPNADLVLQVHYHPTGKPETDRTRIALYYTTRKPDRYLMDVPLGSTRIDIAPGDRTYHVVDHFTLPVDVDVFAVNPHAHYVCREMYGYALLPDGTRRTLIRIPDWNFDWQQLYTYPRPVRLPAGTDLRMEFTYDNSADNPRNPHQPPREIRWGPSSTDEMAGLHIEVAPADPDDADELSDSLWGKMMRQLGGGIYRPR